MRQKGLPKVKLIDGTYVDYEEYKGNSQTINQAKKYLDHQL